MSDNPQHPDSSPGATPSASPARLLIVDDEPYIREVLSRWLTSAGYDCVTAASGEKAWELLHRGSFSLLISDIKMPGMSGIMLLAMTKERLVRDVAVVMITAVDDRKTAIRALELGAYGYIIKPFDENEVIIHVVNALERRRLTLASRQYEQRLETEVRQQTAQVHRREEEIALRLVSAASHRDDETGEHIRRIGLYAECLAGAVGWGAGAVREIRIAAPMHDIGKIGVPDQILLKPGRLTPEEFESVKKHSEIGAAILDGSDIPLLRMATDIALSHHEKWDGSGYPQGLVGPEIPASARLVAIADVYDALVNKRVYRPALPEDEALAIMTEGRGAHFDPDIFDCCIDVLDELRQIRTEVGGTRQLSTGVLLRHTGAPGGHASGRKGHEQ